MNNLDLGKVVGSKIHKVTGMPAAELGLADDWAMDLNTGAVWHKTAEGWQNEGSFKGEKGDAGETGAQGDTGEKGDKGDKGDTGEAGADGKTPMLSINASGHLIATYE